MAYHRTLVLLSCTMSVEALAQLHSALEGRVGQELRGFANRFQASCSQGSNYLEDMEGTPGTGKNAGHSVHVPSVMHDDGARPGTHIDTQLH